jgi:hypothetical protein
MLVYPTLNNQGGTKLSIISHNIHMGHYRPNFKLGRVWHTPPQRTRRPHRAQHTHNQANDNQERFLLAHATVRLVLAHVPRRALRRAYTCNEPHVQPLARTRLWSRRSALIPFVTPQSPNGSDPLCTLNEPQHISIPLTLSSLLRVKGLTRGWWDGL